MNAALALARSYGVSIRFAELGHWGDSELRSEYDPSIPEIRIDLAIAARFSSAELGKFVELAVGHELYHHRESIGEIPTLRDSAARESAAADYARSLSERPA